jgi:hypothetical protein
MKFPLESQQTTLLGGTILAAVNSVRGTCKATFGSALWPSIEEWAKLNDTLSGALLKPPPPAAACHPDQPSFNSTACAIIQAGWTTWDFHVENPLSSALNNWNNDSCLPMPNAPCSSEGYPVYVVNATTVKQVTAAVNFARDNNIRLNVKGSSHDFLGRSVAPNSLSIWTHHMKGIRVHDSFRSQGPLCFEDYAGSAITIRAGVTHGEAFAEANKHNLMIHVAGAPTVGFGGYITGGGHSVLSLKYGLAADAVLQLTIVTPDGKLRMVNECSEPDLFWALRGGGGATFGVIVDFTFQAFLSEPASKHTLILAPTTNDTSPLLDTLTYAAALLPKIADNGVMAYSVSLPASETLPEIFGAIFVGVNLSSSRVGELVAPIEQYAQTTYPTELFVQQNISNYNSVYEFWVDTPDTTTPVGIDLAIGSRLLDAKALQRPSFRTLFAISVANLHLVSGPGVHARSTSFNAVSPAWRTAYVHSSELPSWPCSLDVSAKYATQRLV